MLIIVVVAFSLGGAVAGAKKKKWPSQITLSQPSSTQFTGAVSSKFRACRNQRLVTVYYTDPVTGQTQPLSVQRTNKAGKYQVDLTQPAFGGSYQAQVSKASKQRAQTCRGAQSNVVSVVSATPFSVATAP